MVIFNSYVSLPEGTYVKLERSLPQLSTFNTSKKSGNLETVALPNHSSDATEKSSQSIQLLENN